MNVIFRTQIPLVQISRLNHRCRIIAEIAILLIALLMTGCSTHGIKQTALTSKTDFALNAPDFVMEKVNVSGQASCFYILFSIPLCRDQNLATIAWEAMRKEAQMEGKSAQFVNIAIDRSLNWNFLFLLFQENYSVSANTIVYK